MTKAADTKDIAVTQRDIKNGEYNGKPGNGQFLKREACANV